MEKTVNAIFKNKKVNLSKLISFGFNQNGSDYIYTKPLLDGDFNLTVTISASGDISTEVIDTADGEIYTLHLVKSASGSFVGKVRDEYEKALEEIASECFEPDVFKSEQTKALINYVRDKYGDELEFLWEKFDDNAVWRRNDTKKWYAVLLTLPKRKLSIDSDETAEIIDLRIKPEKMEDLIDHKRYFPGWHMNKKSWYTIILDNSVSFGEICDRVDESYMLAVK